MASALTIPAADIAEHPAFKAWSALAPGRAPPERIDVLRRKKKSAVYRLTGAGPGGSAVVAKRCRPESAAVERTIYEEVLPQLALRSLEYFGTMEEPGGECTWLFLEDAGGLDCAPCLEEHARLTARWLGRLHTGTVRSSAAARLPDRGPDHYLDHLRRARESILGTLANPLLHPGDRALLRAIVAQCDLLEARWSRILDSCERMPRALVHGDLVLRNMRVRDGAAGSALLVYDWETAGWGAPAADLSQLPIKLPAPPDLSLYWETVRESWPGLRLDDMRRLAEVGSLFRLLAMIRWEGEELQYQSVQKAMGSLRIYQAEMTRALQDAGWLELQ
jgi:thiamine kinase-like enzyme